MQEQEICWMSASDLATAIKMKKISPVEVVKHILKRIAAINPEVNAYVTITEDSALTGAREAEDAVMNGRQLGPLHGVPVAIKDTNFTKGVRTTMGSRLMEDFIPEEDSVHVDRLKKAGAIILGKTNTPEFAAKAVTENLVFGSTRNPWNLERTTGGSSGGSASAVAAGLTQLATGSDAGGSIRIPASCCGVFGIKPQFGRVPIYPLFHLWESLLHEGPIARTVKDAALMLDVMAGPHWGDRYSIPAPGLSFAESLEGGATGLKVAWSSDLGYAAVSHQVRAICEAAIKEFSAMGAEIEETQLDCKSAEATYAAILDTELAARLSIFGPLDKFKNKIDPSVAERVASVQNLTANDYLKILFTRQELSAKVGKFFQKYDLLLTPTIGVPAWPIGLPKTYVEEVDGKPLSTRGWTLTFPFNLTGHPAASIPAGSTDDNLPIGLQIVGRPYDEVTVFRAAAAFEEAKPWVSRRPPLR